MFCGQKREPPNSGAALYFHRLATQDSPRRGKRSGFAELRLSTSGLQDQFRADCPREIHASKRPWMRRGSDNTSEISPLGVL